MGDSSPQKGLNLREKICETKAQSSHPTVTF